MPSDYGTIILAAVHGQIHVVRDIEITEDAVNSIKVKFEFRTNDWEDVQSRMAVFWKDSDFAANNKSARILIPLDENYECFIPASSICGCSGVLIGIYGSGDEKRIVSNYIHFNVGTGCFGIGQSVTPAEPVLFDGFGIVLCSDSGKKFKISVDDYGNLSTEEVHRYE